VFIRCTLPCDSTLRDDGKPFFLSFVLASQSHTIQQHKSFLLAFERRCWRMRCDVERGLGVLADGFFFPFRSPECFFRWLSIHPNCPKNTSLLLVFQVEGGGGCVAMQHEEQKDLAFCEWFFYPFWPPECFSSPLFLRQPSIAHHPLLGF